MNSDLINKIEIIKDKYKVVDKETLLPNSNKYVTVETNKYILNNGSVRTFDCLLKNKKDGNAVVIIPILENGNFLMIVESRPVIEENVIVEFPAGMIDNNEEPINAALRELQEETGYTSNDIKELEWHYQDQGSSKAIIKTYLALNCKKVSEQHLDSEEELDPIEVTLEDLKNLLDEGTYLVDANTKIAAYTYMLKK